MTATHWPPFVPHVGLVYTATGKTGTNTKTGLPCAEYRNTEKHLDRRLWLLEDGTIVED